MSKTAPLTLIDLLNHANEGYPDGFLSEYFDPHAGERKHGEGDTLAEFIVVELSETFDASSSREEQVEKAHRVLNNAIAELEGVIQAIC